MPVTHVPPVEWTRSSPAEWRAQIEPVVAGHLRDRAASLRRYRAQIGEWSVELVGDDARTHRLFAADWATAPAGRTDVYLYVFGSAAAAAGRESPQVARAVACIELGRGLLTAPASYRAVRELCRELVAGPAASARRRARKRPATELPAPAKLALPAACAEFVVRSGESAGVLLLGSAAVGKSTHACLLARSRPGAALVADGWTMLDPHSSATSPESRFLVRAGIARSLPRLLPAVVVGLLEADALTPELAAQVARFHGPADLAKGIDDGLIPEATTVELRQCLAAAAEVPVLIRAVDWIEPNRIADSTRITHSIWLERGLPGDYLLRTLDAGETMRRLAADVIGRPCRATAERELVAQWGAMATPHGAVLDAISPVAITQFCLRHYLDGLSDSARMVLPGDESAAAIAREMRLDEPRRLADSRERPQFCQGPYPVRLLLWELGGKPVEAVAIDDRCAYSNDAVDAFAQIKAIWPGQIADFFTRHGPLRLRELFAEVAGC